jgi:hypothetical protein
VGIDDATAVRRDVSSNRSRDGTYGPGNSGDGKTAEKAALDARERETGIPLERTQVRATHPDVRSVEPLKFLVLCGAIYWDR